MQYKMLWAAAVQQWVGDVHVWSSVGHHIPFLQRERFLVMALALLPLFLLLRRDRDIGCFALVMMAKLPSFFTNTTLYLV